MIARIWRARATVARAPAYAAYLRSTVLPELAALAGYEGVTLLQRPRDEIVEVTVITWWTSLESIRGFAGDSAETAVVHETAAALLIDFDTTVTHHTVAFDE